MPASILVAEDEPDLRRFLVLELQHEGYDVVEAADGRAALDVILEGRCDAAILDVMLPGLNGVEVCRRARQASAIPILMLTARDGLTDKIGGLDAGADDYVTKPFAIEELLARLRAALRRHRIAEAAPQLIAGELVLDPQQHSVTVRGVPVELTKTEFALLECFLRHKNVVLSRETLMNRVWGYDYIGDSNVVDVYVRYLRAKLEEPFGWKLIHTVRGVGYVLRTPADAGADR
ncbi:MAG: response regulator transcription factor [Firmicutes bacterium]|nr:response regulator transcription factor [Bacillota bacterium]